MQTIQLGHTGETVSSLCLGCMYFGSAIDETQSFRLLDQYWDAGGRFLDTANNYAFWVNGYQGGESEQVIGRWLKIRHNRQQVFLATKVGYNMPPRVPISLSQQTIMEQCENSLRQLQTDYIDLYYAHIDDRDTPLEETLSAFNQLVKQGKVRYIACSNTLAWRIEQAQQISKQHHFPAYCCVQQRHSYVRPRRDIKAFSNAHVPVNTDLLDFAKARSDQFIIVAYSVLMNGLYTQETPQIPEVCQPDAYDSAELHAKIQTLREIAHETGATPNQVVIAWVLQNAPAMIALISSSSQERLQENLNALQLTLTADQLARLTGK
jgi:aryl-alcohol dehydrogenase-like predicted oxidoreductase